MNDLQIKGNWKELKGKIKQKYGSIVEDESLYTEGKADELIGKIQSKTGKTKETILNEIDALKN